jgi:phenylalanyl-tRNA synthetase beta subunit
VPQTIGYERIAQAIHSLKPAGLQDFRPIDRLSVGKIAPEYSSLLLRVTFQSETHTLTSEEIEQLSKQLMAALSPLGIRLRT